MEFEVRKLQQRIAALEQGEIWTEPAKPVTAPVTELTVEPTPQPDVPSAPPPLPIAIPAPAPAPVPPPRPPRAEPVAPAEPSFLHELLQTLQLIPPRAGTSGEAQLGAWWATRIGALLAVIGVVFFGIYLSAHTTPLVRWVELAAIAAGATLAGAHFERRRLRIGPVITGAGLALTYFSAFAAYAVPAVKIIDSIALAAVFQIAAVAYIGLCAVKRNSATIAFFAVLLGYVSAFVSLEAGLGEFSAVAGLGLSITAIAYLRTRGWMGPAYASAALSPLLNIVLASLVWKHPTTPLGEPLLFVFIAAGFMVHLFPLWRVRATDSPLRIMQTTQTAMHALAAVVTTIVLFGQDALAPTFFATGGALTLVSVWIWRRLPDDRILGMFAVKASSLLALGIIVEWDARTRWIALLVEAFVLLAGAARTRRASLAVMSLIAWAVSLAFYGFELAEHTGTLRSPTGIAVALYLVAGTLFLTWLNQVWSRISEPSHALLIALAAGAAIPAQFAASVAMSEAWMVVASLGLIAALEGVRRWQSSRVPLAAMAVLAINAHVSLQAFHESQWNPGWLWAGALGLVGLSFGAAAAAKRRPQTDALRLCLVVAAHAALAGAVLQSVPHHPAFFICTAIAVALAFAGRRLQQADLLAGGALSLVTGTGLALFHTIDSALPSGDLRWSVLSALGIPLAWTITAGRKAPALQIARWGIAIIGVFIIWIPVSDLTTTTLRGLVIAGVASGLAWQARALALRPARMLAGTLAITAALELSISTSWPSHPHPWVALLGLLVLGLSLASLPLWWHSATDERSDAWAILLGLAGALLLSHASLTTPSPWQDYGSGLWAMSGLAVFGLGLAFRARSHRIIGLAVIALCIPRVFVHDINDAKHRIIAFILLGVLLIWVGFSYQRFRHLIEDRDPGKSE